MKKKYKKRRGGNSVNNDMKRRAIINNIQIYDDKQNVRSILDDALSFNNTNAEAKLEYREREIKHFMVNHIRHLNSSYEEGLKQINLLSGNYKERRLNYLRYKNVTLNRIAEAYPFLEAECNQQKHRLRMTKAKSS